MLVIVERIQRVVAKSEEHLERIGLLLQDRRREHGPDAVRRVCNRKLILPAAVEAPAIGHLGKRLVGELADATAETGVFGPFFDEHPALGFDAAHQSVQHHDGAPQVDFVGMAGSAVAVMEDDRWFGLVELLGQLHDFHGGNSGFRLGPLRGVRIDEGAQRIEALHPAIHIFHVVEVMLADDDMHQGVVQGQVRSRPDHQVAVGLRCGDAHPRVDVGEPGTLFHRIQERVHRLDFHALENIPAVQHHVPRVAPVGVDLGVRVSDQRAAGGIDGSLADGIVREIIRRTDRFHERLG